MKILFTGSSSFTGYWFIRYLIEEGHEVMATFTKKRSSYKELREIRVEAICSFTNTVFETSFGDETFLELIEGMDVICHHGADVINYKSLEFDYLKALERNTHNVRKVFDRWNGDFVLTGSYFEQRENGSRAVSPYGLSKGLTADVFNYFGETRKFVIPNPFGPMEEMRFTSYLAREWLEEREAIVSYPKYVRDNIPVTILAKEYVRFIEAKEKKNAPSFYVSSQGEFAEKFAKEMRVRWNLPCQLRLLDQVEFSEPEKIVNSDLCLSQWDEKGFWDSCAAFYKEQFACV